MTEHFWVMMKWSNRWYLYNWSFSIDNLIKPTFSTTHGNTVGTSMMIHMTATVETVRWQRKISQSLKLNAHKPTSVKAWIPTESWISWSFIHNTNKERYIKQKIGNEGYYYSFNMFYLKLCSATVKCNCFMYVTTLSGLRKHAQKHEHTTDT